MSLTKVHPTPDPPLMRGSDLGRGGGDLVGGVVEPGGMLPLFEFLAGAGIRKVEAFRQAGPHHRLCRYVSIGDALQCSG